MEFRATKMQDARRVLEEHTRVCVPEPVCKGCLRRWPCFHVEQAHEVLIDGES